MMWRRGTRWRRFAKWTLNMSVHGKLLASLIVLLLHGCSESSVPMKSREAKGDALSAKNSGYVPGVRQWSDFLSCWKMSVTKNSHDTEPSSVLVRGSVREAAASADRDIDTLEKSLGTALPASYKDFIRAYMPASVQGAVSPRHLIGMFPPSQVQRLKSFDPDAVRLAEKYPIDSSDKEYFLYGTRQDGVRGKNRYWAESIVVGKYGEALFERIVLYPQSRTADGEFEAALHFHASEFRAPSFAELMRQLSYLETNDPNVVPPYAQAALKNTCADKLTLSNVWWD
jgi:hypothetical protein